MVCAKDGWFDTPKSDGPRAVTKVRWSDMPKPDGFKIESRIKKKKI